MKSNSFYPVTPLGSGRVRSSGSRHHPVDGVHRANTSDKTLIETLGSGLGRTRYYYRLGAGAKRYFFVL